MLDPKRKILISLFEESLSQRNLNILTKITKLERKPVSSDPLPSHFLISLVSFLVNKQLVIVGERNWGITGDGRKDESLKKWRGGELECSSVSLFLFFKIIYG